MARKNPLGTIKDAAIGTILQPKATAEKAVGTVVEGAKGGVGLGMTVAGQVAAKATDTVTSLLPGRKPTAPDLEPAEPAAASRKSQGDPVSPKRTAPKAAPRVTVSPDQPVNVTKELGLDEAPVAETTPPAQVEKPLTSIDAAADATDVDVTPADIAPAVKKAPANKAPAKKAAAKKAPAKKAAAKKTTASTPGDKLPPPTS